jgi:hypothetical protein
VADVNKVGVDQSPLSICDVNEDFKIAELKRNYSSSVQGLKFVYRFLGEYYELYDNNNREQLMRAYHQKSRFSLTSTYPLDQSSSSSLQLVKYVQDSHKLPCVEEKSRRSYQGSRYIIIPIQATRNSACSSFICHGPKSFLTRVDHDITEWLILGTRTHRKPTSKVIHQVAGHCSSWKCVLHSE